MKQITELFYSTKKTDWRLFALFSLLSLLYIVFPEAGLSALLCGGITGLLTHRTMTGILTKLGNNYVLRTLKRAKDEEQPFDEIREEERKRYHRLSKGTAIVALVITFPFSVIIASANGLISSNMGLALFFSVLIVLFHTFDKMARLETHKKHHIAEALEEVG
ncbi:hypothetical protein IMZ31_24045 (plasmid) [Pontibacillus sp. ALD_SL1]|uniref:hypothetical protein n=1 Tax=Pontibacillus sp. ALD_SL1 TaxID=2777185 RepID=UPI001A97BB6D|nr:hypothetical protein [Pontibacillus sp. ALD_SL1]QST02525.1 hypothetical protein IMZ31_24045 [Pontibacillus sp. ALD_SL1]